MTEDQFLNQLYQEALADRQEQERISPSSDWGRKMPPIVVDFKNLFNNYPKHRFCNLIIKDSPKGRRGLYCADHNKQLCWINTYQEKYLRFLGFDDSNPKIYENTKPLKPNSSPYALVYKNKDIYTIYVSFGEEQIRFYWNEKNQAEHRAPTLRSNNQIVDGCCLLLFNTFSAKMEMYGKIIEFIWEKNVKSQDASILFRGPIVDHTGEWKEAFEAPDYQADSPTSQGIYNGIYHDHYSAPQPYESYDD